MVQATRHSKAPGEELVRIEQLSVELKGFSRP